mmetsp:Transcript_128697/g.223175  ORF Transcript_128697/g.223175 Transcript_128697/m.223175 type:complete len:290 (-) Transcript_128697:13-882(-)
MKFEDLVVCVQALIGLWILVFQFHWSEMSKHKASELPLQFFKRQKEIAFLVFVVGQLVSNYRRRVAESEAERRKVRDTLNISLNSVEQHTDGLHLKFRTLQEVPQSLAFPDKIQVERIRELQSQTTVANPFLQFDGQSPKDEEINKMLCNHLSSLCAQGYLASEMGLPVREESFAYVLTYERFEGDPVATVKLRVLLVREQTLRHIYDLPEHAQPMPNFEAQSHRHRWSTLRKMAAMFFNDAPDTKWMKANKLKMAMRADPEEGLNSLKRPLDVVQGDELPHRQRARHT